MSTETSDWVVAVNLDELEVGGRTTFRHGPHQVLLLRSAEGVTAIDNRCPHEGYPLSQGDVKDGNLTCAWHNWKFRLRDGACVLGGEDVRRFDVKVEDGQVLVDLEAPPADEQIPKLEASLDAAFDDADWGRAARDVERLIELGHTFGDVLGFACDWAARHGKYGMSHGLAASADYVTLAETFPDDAHVMLLEAMHSLVDPHLRRPEQTFADSADDEATSEGLRKRIEAEDLSGAQAVLRGMLGAGPDDVFDALTRAATDHFYDYGHGHIYVVKAEELLRSIGWSHAHPVLTSLVSTLVYGTREDTLPYMRGYRNAMELRAERIAVIEPQNDEGTDVDADAFDAAVLGAQLAPALDAVLGALEAGVRPDRIALRLGLAASERLLRFDHAIDVDPSVSEGWLHATHLVTHADAVRESLLRHPSKAALRGLFQSARLIQHTHPLDAEDASAPDVEIVGDPKSVLFNAVTTRDPMRGTVAAMQLAGVPEVLEHALLESCLRTPLVLPIFVQHHVKTVLAAVRLARAAREDKGVDAVRAARPLVATARFLCHPQRERRFRTTAAIARDFVRDGVMRGNLLGY